MDMDIHEVSGFDRCTLTKAERLQHMFAMLTVAEYLRLYPHRSPAFDSNNGDALVLPDPASKLTSGLRDMAPVAREDGFGGMDALRELRSGPPRPLLPVVDEVLRTPPLP
jgi:hypothetical protein